MKQPFPFIPAILFLYIHFLFDSFVSRMVTSRITDHNKHNKAYLLRQRRYVICEQVSHTIIPDQTSTEVPWPFGVEAHVLKSATLCLELGTYS